MANFRQLLQNVKSEINEVTPEEAEKLLSDGWQILDVREPDEFSRGRFQIQYTLRVAIWKVLLKEKYLIRLQRSSLCAQEGLDQLLLPIP